MNEKKWLVEILIKDKTCCFEYETKEMALFDIDKLLNGITGQWVHVQDSYFKAGDIEMVSYRKIVK